MSNIEAQPGRIPMPDGSWAAPYRGPQAEQSLQTQLKTIPAPGGEIPKNGQWHAGVITADRQETGVTAPDGKFYKFNDGETFALIKDTKSSERMPFIIDKNGNEIPFENWNNQTSQENQTPQVSPSSESQPNTIPAPGGEVATRNLWETSMNHQTGQETGVKDPSGKFYEFKNGESFAQIKDSTGERKPFIIDQAGNEMKFHDWANQNNLSEHQAGIVRGLESAQENTLKSLDLQRLNRIARETGQPGARYGREVNLGSEDIKVVVELMEIVEKQLAKVTINNAEWDKAESYLAQQINNGSQMLKDSVIDGGSISSPIYKTIKTPSGGVTDQVILPEQLYKVYAWNIVLDLTKRELVNSRIADDTSANGLYSNLTKLSFFLKSNNLL